MGVGFLELSLVVFVSLFTITCSPTFLEHLCIVTLDARGCLAWTSLGIILFLRSLYSKFSSVQVGLDFFGYYFISSIIILKVQVGAAL